MKTLANLIWGILIGLVTSILFAYIKREVIIRRNNDADKAIPKSYQTTEIDSLLKHPSQYNEKGVRVAGTIFTHQGWLSWVLGDSLYIQDTEGAKIKIIPRNPTFFRDSFIWNKGQDVVVKGTFFDRPLDSYLLVDAIYSYDDWITSRLPQFWFSGTSITLGHYRIYLDTIIPINPSRTPPRIGNKASKTARKRPEQLKGNLAYHIPDLMDYEDTYKVHLGISRGEMSSLVAVIMGKGQQPYHFTPVSDNDIERDTIKVFANMYAELTDPTNEQVFKIHPEEK